MDFSEALKVLRNGGKVRRALWSELDEKVGSWLEIVSGVTSDGRPIRRCPMVWHETAKDFAPWAGAGYDILHEDWEEMQ